MDSQIIKKITLQIHNRFPEFSGVEPKVQKQQLGSQPQGLLSRLPLPKAAPAPTYLLTFHHTSRTGFSAQSKSISRWVRVVVNERGRILKITTSR